MSHSIASSIKLFVLLWYFAAIMDFLSQSGRLNLRKIPILNLFFSNDYLSLLLVPPGLNFLRVIHAVNQSLHILIYLLSFTFTVTIIAIVFRAKNTNVTRSIISFLILVASSLASFAILFFVTMDILASSTQTAVFTDKFPVLQVVAIELINAVLCIVAVYALLHSGHRTAR